MGYTQFYTPSKIENSDIENKGYIFIQYSLRSKKAMVRPCIRLKADILHSMCLVMASAT